MMDMPPADQPAIVVTASRTADAIGDTPATVTVIDQDRIIRIGAPLIPDLLRLVPSAAVSTSGPAGSLTQVRIRGAEANHTLLFIDGIRANDPAAGNEPRFELLNADIASRIEVVRGPQSALWGSEAIGGVVAVDGTKPGGAKARMTAEYGSFDTLRGAIGGSNGNTEQGLSLAAAGQRSDGVDSFDGTGDRDGYRNVALRGSGRLKLADEVVVGASGFALWEQSQFDGYDPATFLRADTLDESRNRLAAGRLFAEVGDRSKQYLILSGSLLGSSNRNFLADDPINRTSATRRTAALEGGLTTGRHSFVAAIDAEREAFRARDVAYGGFTDQDRTRTHRSVTLAWKMRDLGPVTTDLTVRHDMFDRFKDATSIRAGIMAKLGGGFSAAASYGEGIAQPSFFDLYGFFPGSFVGNPGLKPESSVGGEWSLRYSGHSFGAAVTYYRQRLKDEIVDTFDPDTFLSSTANARGTSKRQGIEAEAAYRPNDAIRVTLTYAWLDASEPQLATGLRLKEQRRPRHSGSIAVDGVSGRLSYGAALSYTGAHIDTNFDVFPADRVNLRSYWLAGGQAAYRVGGPVEVTLRIANAFDSGHQDVVGYRSEGRSVHAGFRVALGR
ncbi:TonB-dependent receptor plug domain-containing protein [Sphingomonas jaspsi]|uniref:TonB-dependent receptor plug domain-containing protein n=1 Tax=Sphingomonas jaspsi TaxID=392409 RepID=UPI0004B97342|nr:TonB-dependent receptor [Sphingomonas jaspsi]